MADTNDYLTVYKRFFENFAKTVNPDDQLPVRVAGYRLWDSEIVGETVDWTLQYLGQRNCPPSLLAPITRIVIDEIKQAVETQPAALGFKSQENCYLPLKLMQAVTNKVNEVCLRFCDNGRVTSLPPPSPGPLISSCAVKNSRRCMEDRHVILEDFHAFFNIKDANPASYYAVFDGHAGTDAAIYSVSHLHQFLAESSFYPSDPEKAIKDAFLRTDDLFIEKSNKENLQSGTTAVCALLRPTEKKLYVAWLGDSQAILVRNGHIIELVNPHKPERQDEMSRIKDMGGNVMFWGTWRVNGQLAVSRAIGDLHYKPYVTAEPDVRTVDLLGDEDFLILACDGLWDFATPEDVVKAVYKQLQQNPADLEAVSQKLVQLSKQQGSTDNITVIVAFLTEPSQLVARAANGPQAQPSAPAMEAFDFNTNPFEAAAPAPAANPNNPFEVDLPSPTVCVQKAAPADHLGSSKEDPFQAGLPFNNGHANGDHLFDFTEHSANGKEHRGEDDDEDDSGPETVDGRMRDVAKAGSNPFDSDLELQRQQLKEFDADNEPRGDTPTPPADEVPGVIGLVSDNVAESGEESEDEWNYYRVDPSEKSQPPTEKEPQTKPEVCPEEPVKVEELDENMESQLNPNAAEFVPSPTQSKPSMEEILNQTQSSEIDSFFNDNISTEKLTEVLIPQDKTAERNGEISTSHEVVSQNSKKVESNLSLEETCGKDSCVDLNESAAFSTKAEYGDESRCGDSDFRKIMDASNSINEDSLMECDFLASEEQIEGEIPLKNVTEPSVLEHSPNFEEDVINEFQKEPVHISFELQKEIAPLMESQPERVKVDSEEHSPTEESIPDVNKFSENKEVDELDYTCNNVLMDKSPGLQDPLTMAKPAFEDPEFISTMNDLSVELKETVNIAELSRNEENIVQQIPLDPSFTGKNLEISELGESTKQDSPKISIEDEVQQIANKMEVPSQCSEYSLSEVTDELPVLQETLNQLSNEMSTPEYEKLEKDLEASEQYHNEVSVPDVVPMDQPCISKGDENASDVLLESAHPNKVELLNDACVESGPMDFAPYEIAPLEDLGQFSNRNLAFSPLVPDTLEHLSSDKSVESSLPSSEVCAQLESVQLIESDIKLKDLSSVPNECSPSIESPHSAPMDMLEASSNDNAIIDLLPSADHVTGLAPETPLIPSSYIADSLLNEPGETTQAPPPTPLITQLADGETLDFIGGSDNFSEVVEKLSVTQQFQEINGLEEIETVCPHPVDISFNRDNQSVEDSSVNSQLTIPPVTEAKEIQELSPEVPNDANMADAAPHEDDNIPVVGAATAAVAAATVAAAAAITSTAVVTPGDKEVKKEKEVPVKKSPVVTKDKKPSTDKPKMAAKAPISSRVTGTAAKTTKTPPVPAKIPTVQKTAPPKQSPTTVTSKPLSKTTVTKTATKPLSNAPSRPTSNAAPATMRMKPTVPAVSATRPTAPAGLTKTRPSSSPLEKKPITNGDIKTAAKRPEQLITKSSTTRVSPRPTSAPAPKMVNKTLTTASTTMKKSPLSDPGKPRPLSSVTQVRTVTKTSNEKEIKETANKQISTRTTTVRSTTASTATKASVTSAPRKVENKVLTNGKAPALKTSSMVKTSTTTTSRISPKKPAATTKVKTTKTDSIVQKSEIVQDSETVIATNE